VKKIYSAGNLLEAHLLLHTLRQAGIEAKVLNENIASALGEIPFTQTYPELWLINEQQEARALDVVRSFLQRESPRELRICGHCGEQNPANFLTCWSCGGAIG
jgi:Putative prokaryotic signal transducing protein